MVLKNNLYSITNRESVAELVEAFLIHLNTECFIYKAHFPGHPITPGVCVTQIAVELAEEMLGCKLQMTGAKNIRFLTPMVPVEGVDVTYTVTIKPCPEQSLSRDCRGEGDVEPTSLRIQAIAQTGDTVYANLSLKCKK